MLAAAGLYSVFAPRSDSPEWEKLLREQSNPFTVPADSSDFVWARALAILNLQKRLISGGAWRMTDSVILIPYSNSYRKGSSVRVTREKAGDSVMFRADWWYSGERSESGSKEIAVYMRQGKSRYDY